MYSMVVNFILVSDMDLEREVYADMVYLNPHRTIKHIMVFYRY